MNSGYECNVCQRLFDNEHEPNPDIQEVKTVGYYCGRGACLEVQAKDNGLSISAMRSTNARQRGWHFLDERFRQTKFLVRASHEEASGIWFRWHHVWGLALDLSGHGWASEIGNVAGRMIRADVAWSTVLGELVAFVDCCSQLADHAMLEDWIPRAFPNLVAQADAANFGNVLSAIERHTSRFAALRDINAVERALRALPLVSRAP